MRDRKEKNMLRRDVLVIHRSPRVKCKAAHRICSTRYLMSLPFQDKQSKCKHCRKYRCRKQAGFQIAACQFSKTACHSRTDGGTKISGQGQECEHCHTALWTVLGEDTDRTWPHNAYSQTAESTACKSQNRGCGQGGQKITAGAHCATDQHSLGQIKIFTEYTVQYPGDPRDRFGLRNSEQLRAIEADIFAARQS